MPCNHLVEVLQTQLQMMSFTDRNSPIHDDDSTYYEKIPDHLFLYYIANNYFANASCNFIFVSRSLPESILIICCIISEFPAINS